MKYFYHLKRIFNFLKLIKRYLVEKEGIVNCHTYKK